MLVKWTTVLLILSLNSYTKGMEKKEILRWKTMDFVFKTEERHRAYSFDPKTNMPSGMAVTWHLGHGHRIFFAIPRAQPGVPFTLAYVEIKDIHGTSPHTPKLTPYPDEESQHHNNQPWGAGDQKLPHQPQGGTQDHTKPDLSVNPVHFPQQPQNFPQPPVGADQNDQIDDAVSGMDRLPQNSGPQTFHEQEMKNDNDHHHGRARDHREVTQEHKQNRDQMYHRQNSRSDVTLHSVYSIKVDTCNRLWVIDSGIIEGHAWAMPQIIVYSLQDNFIQKRFVFPPQLVSEDSLFANIVVEQRDNNCADMFAYIADMKDSLLVYSMMSGKAWRVKHDFFKMEPQEGMVNIHGRPIHLDYAGVYGLALSKSTHGGTRTAYFSPLASSTLYQVPNTLLQHQPDALIDTDAENISTYNRFFSVGNLGKGNDIGTSLVNHDVLFFAQISQNSISCWRLHDPFDKEHLDQVMHHTEDIPLDYPADVAVDHENHLWVLSTKYPVFTKQPITVDPGQVNIRVFVASANKLIAGTKCSAASALRALSALLLAAMAVFITY